jgi:hypothetical protein
MDYQSELDLITRIRGEVMSRKEPTGENLFLAWGYPTAIVFLIEFAVLMFLHRHWYEWLWVGIPLVGVPLMIHFQKKDYERTGHRTIEANIALQMWIYIGVASAVFGFITGIMGIYPIYYCVIQGLLIGMGSFLTGVISRFRSITICGIIASILTFVCLFFQGDLWLWQFLVIAVVAVVAFIIPGHIMRQYVKKNSVIKEKDE